MYGVQSTQLPCVLHFLLWGTSQLRAKPCFFVVCKVLVGLGMKRGSTFSLHSRPLVAYSCIPLAWDQAYPIQCPTSVPVM